MDVMILRTVITTSACFNTAVPIVRTHVGGMLDYLHIGVRVPNLREAAQRCEDLGFTITWEGLGGDKPYDPNSDELPSEAFKIEDPDGIVVDITEQDDQWPGVDIDSKS